MEDKRRKVRLGRGTLLLALMLTIVLALGGCDSSGVKTVRLNAKKPVTISVWHYYNGAIMNALESMIKDFNETVGEKEGIIVEGYGLGNVSELEKAVLSSAKGEVGSMDMPNIFASYADTAYEAEKMSILANLDDYFSEKEQLEYINSYIEEGKIGLKGELRIFPIAKSPEVFMINDTDWRPFAQANGLDYDSLATLEDIAQAAKTYYEWTDSLTPDVPNDGKALYGRDSMANLFIIASKGFDVEIFSVKNGAVSVNVDETVMRKIWDNYYLPYISGYFTAYGRYRSDDAKVGDILAYVGASSSASYFPSEVTVSEKIYPIQAKVLPVPLFKDSKNVMVQQGAGMVVTKSTPEEEYASVVFLKWFTDVQNNTDFAALSGYLPVKKEANNYDSFTASIAQSGRVIDDITNETVKTAFEQIAKSEMYTNKAFDGGAAARAVLERNLQDKAVADREAVLQLIQNGSTHAQAIAQYNTEDNFKAWLNAFTLELNEASK